MTDRNEMNRRRLLGAGAALLGAGLATPALALQDRSTEMEPDISQSTHHNISAFRELNWQDYFDNTAHGVIICDTKSRALHFWNADQSVYRLYPTSVPLTDELTRLGRTEVIQKVVNPPWRATQGELERNPDWPTFVAGGDPMNPLGPFALYLSWPAYRIHGTHDTRKIGRRSSNGCIGLYNEHIRQLFDLAEEGTQVILI